MQATVSDHQILALFPQRNSKKQELQIGNEADFLNDAEVNELELETPAEN